MSYYIIIFLLFIVFYIINNFLKKKKFINNYQGKKHQKFLGSKNIPLSGGIFLIISFSILFNTYNLLLFFFLLVIFLIGYASDINFLSSPKSRLLIQFLTIIIFVILLDIQIYQTKFLLLDYFLENLYFRYFFSAFCLLILINGSNFIDGLNGLLLGYFTLVIVIILYLNFYLFLELEKKFIILMIIILMYLFFLNINNKLFMGDSGSYTLSLITGYFLIKIYELNQEISPFFILLLLWYPCFENLFSIIRKFSFKRSPINADNNHLHQLLFLYLKKNKFFIKLNTNNYSSFLINSYNLIIFIISLNSPGNSQFQITLVFINVVIYLIIYFKLFSIKYKNKHKDQ